MENIIDITDESISKESASHVSHKAFITFRLAFALCILFCAITTIIFFWKRVESLDIGATIEHEIFGTYGDFIGGILGTFVALYSVYMLVRTFQNQIVTNENVVSTNKSVVKANESSIETNAKLVSQTSLQIFNSRYFALFQLYKDAVSEYVYEDKKGRSAFEEIVRQFKIKGLDNKTEYKRRSISAVTEYLNLYVSHRRNMSVHFRVLYLLTKLTAEEKIYESYRVSYAKSIRGQLSDEELLILRYNCLSPYGEKMRIYVNKFNLLKHMPIMDLLEFTRWRSMINNEHYYSAINQLVIRIKKTLKSLLDNLGSVNYQYKVSSRLSFDFNLNNTHDVFDIIYTKQKATKRGGAIPRPYEEKAFDCIAESDLPQFFQEIFTEIFLYSNFFQYNSNDNHIVRSSIINNSSKELKVKVSVERKGIPLALAEYQVVPS